jgi:hypothetical protein
MLQLRASPLLVALVGGTVLGLSACGGSKEAAPTTSEFLNSASAICKETTGKLELAGGSFFSGSGGAKKTEADFIKQKVNPIFETGLDRIGGLGAPDGDEDDVKAILAAGSTALDKLRKNPMLIRANPGSPQDPFKDFGRLSLAYGISCDPANR